VGHLFKGEMRQNTNYSLANKGFLQQVLMYLAQVNILIGLGQKESGRSKLSDVYFPCEN
jgi:hypothetical protein